MIRGTYVSYVATVAGHGEESQRLRSSTDGREYELVFDDFPDMTPGSRLNVWGDVDGTRIRVSRIEVLPDGVATEVIHSASGSDEPYPPRRFAMILVDLGNGTNLGAPAARRALLGTEGPDRSVRGYYLEASYGRQDISGEVVGPLRYDLSGCDVAGLARDLRPQVPGVFDHYLWYFGSRVPACYWTGLAETGTAWSPAHDSWYNAAGGCVEYIQEPAHNVGLKHSSFMLCNGARFHDVPQGNCTHSEYGDLYDPLGGGCRHLNGYQKAVLGWFSGCNIAEATSSITVTLLPLELSCHGVQVLMVSMPRKRPFAAGRGGPSGATELSHYYLEFRSPRGLDQGLRPVVQIRVSGDVRNRGQGPFNSWILDMDPGTSVPDGLYQGQSFSDPAGGVTIHVDAIGSSGATVRVELSGRGGPVRCLDGSLLSEAASVGPDTCAATPTATPAATIPDAGPDSSSARADGGPGDLVAPPPAPPPSVDADPNSSGVIIGGCACDMAGAGPPAGAIILLVALAALSWRRSGRRR